MLRKVKKNELYSCCTTKELPFKTTKDIEEDIIVLNNNLK